MKTNNDSGYALACYFTNYLTDLCNFFLQITSATASEEPTKKRARVAHSSKTKIKPITPVRVTAQDLFGDER